MSILAGPTVRGRTGRAGRPPVTSRPELERVAIALFMERGFDSTSVEDIAQAAGIGRRTFFGYFESKADVVWGDFDDACDQMRRMFDGVPATAPLDDAIRSTIIAFNHVDEDSLEHHRRRMTLILGVPTLTERSATRYVQWRSVVAEFASRRLGGVPEDVVPRTIGHCALACSLSAYEEWLAKPGVTLSEALEATFRTISFSALARPDD